jgi:hypothetical protein
MEISVKVVRRMPFGTRPVVCLVTVGLEDVENFHGTFFALAQDFDQETADEALHLELFDQLHQLGVLLVEEDLLLDARGHHDVVY